MNAAFRTLLVSALLLPACDGGKKDDAPAAEAAAKPEAAKEGEKAEAAKPEAAKPEAAKPEAAAPAPNKPEPGASIFPGQPGYDCGRLLTKVEIDSTCGTQLAEVTIDRNEGKREQTRCSRRWRNDPTTKARTVSITVGDYGTPEAARGLKVPEDAKEFPEVGDLARGYVEDKTAGIFWHTMRVTQGQYNIDIRSIITDGGPPPCTLDQLAELGRETAKRIEQIPVPAAQ